MVWHTWRHLPGHGVPSQRAVVRRRLVWQRCVAAKKGPARWLQNLFYCASIRSVLLNGEGERGDAGVPGAAQDRGSVCFVSLSTLPTSTRTMLLHSTHTSVTAGNENRERVLNCVLLPLPPPSSLRSARRLTENILTLKPENPIGFMIGELMKRFPDATAGNENGITTAPSRLLSCLLHARVCLSSSWF